MRLMSALAILLLAGCLEPAPASEAEHVVSGAFTAEATQADYAEAGRLAQAEGGEMVLMESFPPQFRVAGFGRSGCERFRAAIAETPYLARVGECTPRVFSDEPDRPTSSP